MYTAVVSPEANGGQPTELLDEVDEAIFRLANQLEDSISSSQRVNMLSHFCTAFEGEASLPLQTVIDSRLLDHCIALLQDQQNNIALIVQVINVLKLMAKKSPGGAEAMIKKDVFPVLVGLFDHGDGSVRDAAGLCTCHISKAVAKNRHRGVIADNVIADKMIEMIGIDTIPRMIAMLDPMHDLTIRFGAMSVLSLFRRCHSQIGFQSLQPLVQCFVNLLSIETHHDDDDDEETRQLRLEATTGLNMLLLGDEMFAQEIMALNTVDRLVPLLEVPQNRNSEHSMLLLTRIITLFHILVDKTEGETRENICFLLLPHFR
ncbi:unnamed protein product [Cylindrotheca closterium]|uniref:Uncharacterized protein n=1 Tax=Cylindrotheca closterium TaxID=2856 RepID=A0AAD2FL80_9STRA|nr:unnamed protein product [Cylindrotheca closterium]